MQLDCTYNNDLSFLCHLLTEIEAEEVSLPLRLDEHQRPLLGVTAILIENADELVLFLVLGRLVKGLHHISASPANKSNLD